MLLGRARRLLVSGRDAVVASIARPFRQKLHTVWTLVSGDRRLLYVKVWRGCPISSWVGQGFAPTVPPSCAQFTTEQSRHRRLLYVRFEGRRVVVGCA